MDQVTASIANNGRKLNIRLGPNYVEYEGKTYHIAQFLAMQSGRAYTPMVSRKERWKSSNMSDYFERLRGDIGDVCAGQLVFFVHYDGSSKKVKKLRTIQRVTKRFSSKSTAILHSGKRAELNQLQITIQVSTSDDTVLKSKEFSIVAGKHILKICQVINTTVIDEAETAFHSFSECINESNESNPEEMTVKVLKQVLTENGISFKSKDRKADLINKFKGMVKNRSKGAEENDGER